MPAVCLPLPPEGRDVPFSVGKDLNGCPGKRFKTQGLTSQAEGCVLGLGVSKVALRVLDFIVLLQTLSVSCPAPVPSVFSRTAAPTRSLYGGLLLSSLLSLKSAWPSVLGVLCSPTPGPWSNVVIFSKEFYGLYILPSRCIQGVDSLYRD